MRRLLQISCLLAIFSGIFFFMKIQEAKKRRPATIHSTQAEAPSPSGPAERVID